MDDIKVTALVCTLSPSPKQSSSDVLASEVVSALATHGVTGKSFRVVDYNVKFGVKTDMGDGDE